MTRTAIFTILRGTKGYDLKCKAFNTYNKYGLKSDELLTAMEILADTFNNSLDMAILFEVGY